MAKRGRKADTWKHPETGETINGLSLRTRLGKKRFFPSGTRTGGLAFQRLYSIRPIVGRMTQARQK